MLKQKNFFIGLSVVVGIISASNVIAEESTSVPVTQMNYLDTGIGPIQVAPGFGDMNVGPHSNFVRIPGGFVSPPHVHSDDYYAVVVSGVVANGREHEKKYRVNAWFVLVSKRQRTSRHQMFIGNRMRIFCDTTGQVRFHHQITNQPKWV